jgi:translation initiation factor 3 subunit A
MGQLTNNSRLDEKLALQRAQEEKAEAKLAAKRAERDNFNRIPSRDRTGGDRGPLMRGTPPPLDPPVRSGTPTSSVGGDAPAPVRRPLPLQSRGGGSAMPGWREREAARKAALAAQGGESGGEREDTAPPPAENKYRPGMLGGRREDRDGGKRDDRDLSALRDGDREPPRREFDREARPPRSVPLRGDNERDESPTDAKTDGKYRPGMFSKMRKTNQ